MARLVQTGLRFTITLPDLLARDRALTAQPQVRTVGPQPGETTTGDYRFLEDYEADMRRLAHEHDDLVELIELPFLSLDLATVPEMYQRNRPSGVPGTPRGVRPDRAGRRRGGRGTADDAAPW